MGTSLGKGNIWSVTVFAPPTVQHCEVPIKKTLAGRGPLLPPLLQLHHLQDQGLWQVELCLSLELPPPGWAHSGATTATTLLGTLGHWSSAMQTMYRCGTLSLGGGEHLWRQCSEAILTVKGVSRRIPWPRAPSRFLTVKGVNPKNTLAKSKAMLSMCLKSFWVFPNYHLWVFSVFTFVQIFPYVLYLSKSHSGECFIILKSSLMKWCLVVFQVGELCAPISTSCA